MSDDDANKILQECIDLKKIYMPAQMLDDDTSASRIDVGHRRNDVVYVDNVFRSAPERSDILSLMKSKIWTEECRTLWHEGEYIFDIINYSTWQEAVVSRYGNCDFYKMHQDTRRDHITYRLVTLVYYVNTIPEQFTGGSLLFGRGEQQLRIEPRHNRAVVFPSFTIHQVENVRLNSEKWEDGRFSINYWFGFK